MNQMVEIIIDALRITITAACATIIITSGMAIGDIL